MSITHTMETEIDILSKVFEADLPWDIDSIDEIASKLVLENQEFISNFYDTLSSYLMCEENEYYNEVLQIFKKIKKDVGTIKIIPRASPLSKISSLSHL